MKGENHLSFRELIHFENIQALCKMDRSNAEDVERLALFFIIAGNDDLYRKKNHIYDFSDRSIKPECLDGGLVDFCGSSKNLIRLGYNLYNNFDDGHSTALDVLSNLDSSNLELAMNAIKVRFGTDHMKFLFDVKNQIFPIEINKDEADYIIYHCRPIGQFFLCEEGKFIGIDNRTGGAWTEEFDDFDKMLKWQLGTEISELDETNEDENEME